jgi:CubicO group peptidase (beta-lactamase class C family)
MIMIDRRAFIVALGGAGCAALVPGSTVHAAGDWETVTFADAGFSWDVAARIDEAVAKGQTENLHSVVVVRGGKLVFERYYSGNDQSRGTPLGMVTFGPDVIHDLRSISKSVVSLLYGIALDDGRVPAPGQPVLDSFPEYAELASDPQRRRITIGHVLSMTMGTEWNEEIPYTNPANSEIAMDLAADRYRYVLDRPMAAEPGKQWTYNGGTSTLLARLIERSSGQALLDYARARLFEPLGIGESQWAKVPGGPAAAASGLRLVPRDLARIGELVLRQGRWADRQVVPAGWLEESFKPRAKADAATNYGYQWWLGTHTGSHIPWIGGFGNGGQRLFVTPELDLVIAITAGNYNLSNQSKTPRAVTAMIMAALKDA